MPLHMSVEMLSDDSLRQLIRDAEGEVRKRKLAKLEQPTPQAFIDAKKERDDGWPELRDDGE